MSFCYKYMNVISINPLFNNTTLSVIKLLVLLLSSKDL